ncbi:uncharacterized protein LOC143220168 [Lasioglossum baleicum]|uniref:uncharacterized protein LOC143220168 n=1 Tax=Lasioglossum baleicum TaxID=434251 RepID=UPI003FCE1E7F
MDPAFVQRVVDTLFPSASMKTWGVASMEQSTDRTTGTDALQVCWEDLELLAWKLMERETAPVPDDIPGRASALAQGALCDRSMQQLNECLQTDKFSIIWKLVCVVLYKKQGMTPDSSSTYGPTCLFSEAGKLIERVEGIRLMEHLQGMSPDLDDKQYGFRRGRSTFDALRRDRSLSEAIEHRCGVVLPANFDIANAFNALPGTAVGVAFMYHKVSAFVGTVTRTYPGLYGRFQRATHCSVRQESVFGPGHGERRDAEKLAPNRSRRYVIRRRYAGDSQRMGEGEDGHARGFSCGLRDSEDTKAGTTDRGQGDGDHLISWKSSRRMPPREKSAVEGSKVEVKDHRRHLDVIRYSCWPFDRHFEALFSRMEGVAAVLGLAETGYQDRPRILHDL